MLTNLKALGQNPGFMRYFQNTSWLMAEKILRMFIGLFVGIWVARYLGPEQFGLLSYAQSFVFLFTVIASLGLDGILVRELVHDEARRDVLLGTAFGLKLIGAVLILPLLATAVQLTSNDTYTNLLIFIIASATIFQSFNVIDFYYQSKVLSKYVALTNTVSLALSSIIKIALLLNKAPLFTFALMTVFDMAVVASGLIYFYRKNSHLNLLNWHFEWCTAKRLLSDSWPLMLSGVVISVYMKIDQVMIKEMLDVKAVGQYAAAVRISEAWYFIPVVIANSLFPAIINSKQVCQELYHERLQRLYTIMVWFAVGVALPMTFLSNWLVSLLYGVTYTEAGGILMIHIWGSVFVFLGVAFTQYLMAENLVMKSFYRAAIGAVANVLLNFLLIPLYGIIGAAIATLLAQLIVNLMYDIFDKDLRLQLHLKLAAFSTPFILLKNYFRI